MRVENQIVCNKHKYNISHSIRKQYKSVKLAAIKSHATS